MACRNGYPRYTELGRRPKEVPFLSEAENIPDLKSAVGLRTVIFSRALEQISEELRETFLLHYEQELEIKQIALVLEVPAGTVKSRLFTARHRLREPLSDAVPEARPARHKNLA